MPSLKDIRTRIDATKNTQQITKAMKLVAAAKLRKAQNQVVGMRPYAYGLESIIKNLAASDNVAHPFLSREHEENQNPNLLLVVFTSDRGLCGGFNAQIIKYTEMFLKENRNQYAKIDVIFIGKKASEYFVKRGVNSLETLLKLDREVSYELAKNTGEKLMEYFRDGTYHKVKFIYNEFKSAISQKVVCEQILPVLETAPQAGEPSKIIDRFIFEPDINQIIDELLHKHFIVQTYRCMCESIAAEHGARMTAMENATNNSKEVISKLTLTYNKIRQEKITTELIEIVSGAEAL
jgi:F-type H+-transporting ATPase subunit gamma